MDITSEDMSAMLVAVRAMHPRTGWGIERFDVPLHSRLDDGSREVGITFGDIRHASAWFGTLGTADPSGFMPVMFTDVAIIGEPVTSFERPVRVRAVLRREWQEWWVAQHRARQG